MEGSDNVWVVPDSKTNGATQPLVGVYRGRCTELTLRAVQKPAPPPNATSVAKNADWDKMAGDAAKALGFTNYTYEARQLPENSTWDDTFKYYSDQMDAAGWGGQGSAQDFEGATSGQSSTRDFERASLVEAANRESLQRLFSNRWGVRQRSEIK